MATADSEKTERIGWLCATIMILGLLFFLAKINACAMACNSCNAKDNQPAQCKDEFFEIDPNNRYRNSHTCTPGATVEVVASPPAPKPGVLCRCINNNRPAPATSAQGN
jgi:hypothetical protein